jgi:recombination protein RecA
MRAVPFTQRQKDIALGSLLGDAYLRPSGNSCALSFAHGEKQRAYLEWKLSEFENFVATKQFYSHETNFHGNAPTSSFSTISHPYLSELRALCYPGGEKHVSLEWLNLLSPLSLAVWYMDDGFLNRRYGTVVLCTNCFTPPSW